MTAFDRTRCTVAAVGLASLGLMAGCSSASPIEDASPAAAAAGIDSDDTGIDSDETSIVTASTVSASSPSSPSLDELLEQDRFVPLAVALERTGLDEAVDGLDDFVLVAPTAAGFASSGADLGIEYSALMNDTQLLEAIMRYHIVADPTTNDSWRTLNGSTLDVDGAGAATVERVDGVEVLDQITVVGGTVLVVPRLLLPTSASLVSG